MKIAVNTRLLLKNRLEGIGWFSFETLKRISRNHPEHQFVFLFDRPFDEDFIFADNIEPMVVFPQSRHPFLWYWWFEWSLPAVLERIKPDLFLSPDGYLSLSSPYPSLPVIHDLNFEHNPKDVPFLVSKYYRHFFPKYAQKAQRIATVSQFSGNDIVSQYGIPGSKIDVVYNGVNSDFKAISEEDRVRTQRRLTDGKPYFIFIGSLHPRKNIERLLKAFDLYKIKTSSGIKLLIAGNKKFWTDKMEAAYQGMTHKEDVVFAGRIPEEEMNEVVGSALAMLYVPYFEGFGIPVVEAMACEVPVITSNITSMPEIADDAAILVDPFSIEAIADAMTRIESDTNLRNSLINKGIERKQVFTWDKTADRLWDSVEKTINESKR